jgi:Clostripain family
MSTQADWTWLVYMAGDNNLEGAGKEDLDEMKEVGSSSELNIIVQFDTEENKTTRYLVEKNKLTVIDEMPGVNTGDPKILTDFIKWGTAKYPAQHYMVDVWNHGGGWENLPSDYDYEGLRASKPALASKIKRLRRSLFRTTIENIHERSPEERAIAIDVGAHDYLDNKELRSAVLNALPNGKKIDILGCDACLMNMIEICYENKDIANFMVGSEETEPGAGWPYNTILKKLSETPQTSPADLAKIITQDYGQYYEKNGSPISDKTATQSALDLNQIEAVATSLNELANILIKNIGVIAGQVSLARDKAQKFSEYPEYVDLISFLNELVKWLPDNQAEAKSAVNKTLAVLSQTSNKFILANSTWGLNVKRASGVSIYFPSSEQYLTDYADLEFSKKYAWNQFLETLFKL